METTLNVLCDILCYILCISYIHNWQLSYSVLKAVPLTINLSFALIFTFIIAQYGVPYVKIHRICMGNALLTPDVLWKWNLTPFFSLLRRTRLLKYVILAWDASQVRLSLPLQEWMAHWGCCKSQRWRSCVPAYPLNPLSPNIVGLGIDRVMPCPVMNCPLKAGWCWAS